MEQIDLLRKPTAILVDDHPAVLDAACKIVQKDFEIVATAGNGQMALQAVIQHRPALLVLDITMPGWSGFETARRVMEASPATKILFLSVFEDIDYMAKAREMGASYVVKRRILNDLLIAAHQTLTGIPFFSGL